MSEMMQMYAGMGMNVGKDFPVEQTLVLNTNSAIIGKISEIHGADEEKALLIANEVYKLALISQRTLTAEEMSEFLSVSLKILEMI